MNRLASLLTAAGLLVLVVPIPAEADTREVSVGNYWFEDDQTGARDPLVVDEGDQISFTIREGVYPPHSVHIDEYGIHSPDLLLFQTYTTPPLDRPGRFALYCRNHRRTNGHETTLIVRARAAPSPTATASAPAPAPKNRRASTTGPTPSGATDDPTPAASPRGRQAAGTPQSTLAPVGVGEASDRRRPPPDPNSLAGLLGRRFGDEAPWTTALGTALLAAVPIAAATAFALRRESRRAKP